MNEHRLPAYTGPVVAPTTDTYLSGTQKPNTGTPTKTYPLSLDWNQKELLWVVLETEVSRLKVVLQKSTDWDDRTNAQDEIPLLEDIITQLRSPK